MVYVLGLGQLPARDGGTDVRAAAARAVCV